MGKSPGHRKWPAHQVREEPVDGTVSVEVNGRTIAASRNVTKVVEDDHPERYYFPRADVQMDMLRRSETTSHCPFKGDAHYFDLVVGDRTLDDAVWSYEDPYDEHASLDERLAFYDDKHPEIRVRLGD